MASDNEFLEKHALLVYNLALRLVGDASGAEDLAQDCLIRALRALPDFREEAAPSTWVYRIVLDTWKDRALRASTASKAAETGLETSEQDALVQRALLELDPESRAIIVLREIQGHSPQEIAAALQLPEAAVRSRLARARGALKESLQKRLAP